MERVYRGALDGNLTLKQVSLEESNELFFWALFCGCVVFHILLFARICC